MYSDHIPAALRLRGLFVKYRCNCHQNPTFLHARCPAVAAAAVCVGFVQGGEFNAVITTALNTTLFSSFHCE